MRRRQTITQQYSPTFRRRISRTYLQLNLQPSMKNKESQKDSVRMNSEDNNDSVTKAQQNLSNFIDSNIRINKIIDQVDLIIRNRMNAHQQGLISVVKRQIQNMQLECQRIVKHYNDMINQKSKQSEIDNLRNQLDYFRTSALNYYQMYKQILEEKQKLTKQIQQKNLIIEELSCAVERTTKKYMRQKAMASLNTERKNKAKYFINNIHAEQLQTTKNDEQIKKQSIPSTQMLTKVRFCNIGSELKTHNLKKDLKISNQQENDQIGVKRYSHSQSQTHKYSAYCRTNMSTQIGQRVDERSYISPHKNFKVRTDEGSDTQKQKSKVFRRSKAIGNRKKGQRIQKQGKQRYKSQQCLQQQKQKVNIEQKNSSNHLYIDRHFKNNREKSQNSPSAYRLEIKQQGKSNSFWRFNQNFDDENVKRNPWASYC